MTRNGGGWSPNSASPGSAGEGIDRSLAPDGELVVVNWHDRPPAETRVAGEPRGPPAERRLSPEATEEAVTDAAPLAVTERVELPPYHFALVFEREG